MLYYGFLNKRSLLIVLTFPAQTSPLAPCASGHSQSIVTKYATKYDAFPHSTEQDTQAIVFLVSRQAVPYWTRGGTCCPVVSTPKIQSLTDSSTTYHDGINNLHHSNYCSNHIIDLHTVNSHLDKWDITTLSQRHKPNSTSQWMEILVRLS
jgi:hypothetical protein